MKRFGNLWNQVCSLENIAEAHRRARRGKRHYSEVQKVDSDPFRHFEEIRSLLVNKMFRNSRYTVMVRKEGRKDREIWKLPYYPDRIIHHCIVNVLEDIWMRGFIRDTYAALPGRGVHDGVRRIRKALRDVDGTQYCLKMDVRKFYQSVDHEALRSVLRRKIKDRDLLWLLNEIIDSAPGVPIGNFTSQYFGNVVLAGLDHWVKEQLRIRYYFRYCDDLVFLGSSKGALHNVRTLVAGKLCELQLDVKSSWQVFPVDARGVDFLGYRFFHGYTLVRKSIVENFKRKRRYGKGSALAAYHGWFVWADTNNLRRKYDV